MMPFFRAFSLCLCLVLLGGCAQVDSLKAWAMGEKSHPPRGAYVITPARENWCYRTLGRVECYPEPQDLPPDSLVSVDPPSRLPLSAEEHARALAATQPLPPAVSDEVTEAEKAESVSSASAPTSLIVPAKK